MSSRRYLENPFPDYDGVNILSSDSMSLEASIEHNLKESISKLFRYWESQLNKMDPSDISVYTGITGSAILYLKMYESKVFSNSDAFLEKSSHLIERSLKLCRNIRVPTFLCGEIGLLTVAAIVNNYLGKNYTLYLQQIVSIENSVCRIDSDLPDEILYGRSGYLYSLLLIRSKIAGSQTIITNELIRHVIASIIDSGKKTSRKINFNCPLAYFWYNEAYVGAAHGYAGILYMLLEACEFLSQEDLNQFVKPTIDFVCSLRYPNTSNFPACIGDEDDKLVHWCHGSPGLIHLLALAYKTFNDPKYLQIASEAADDIWKRGLLKKGIFVCLL